MLCVKISCNLLYASCVDFWYLTATRPFLFPQLTKLRVGHEKSGSSFKWLLEEVVIFSLARGERYVFKCGRWIGGEVELPLGMLLK